MASQHCQLLFIVKQFLRVSGFVDGLELKLKQLRRCLNCTDRNHFESSSIHPLRSLKLRVQVFEIVIQLIFNLIYHDTLAI
ncbi:hypothetical protein L1987_71335 [Smallanthus sonchifolius]|uniref:Uncharacterized protein n=1 Tax=Smallanthus sonchifolius TaxID=185202 RepID=A0ACB9ASZ8_9ASTR|nr:hypothetical protein L1987_71335 [Smallanthus sonchifolius]